MHLHAHADAHVRLHQMRQLAGGGLPARGRGFRLGAGIEPRLVRIQKRLDDAAPDLPCRKWTEIVGGATS